MILQVEGIGDAGRREEEGKEVELEFKRAVFFANAQHGTLEKTSFCSISKAHSYN